MKAFLWSLIVLPGSVLVVIPITLLSLVSLLSNEKVTISENIIMLITSVFFFIIGFYLAETTMRLFLRYGKGTPAPWNPPQHFVIQGPYRYVRNPMIIGVLFILVSEAFFFSSLVLFFWVAVFFIANALYFPFIEEKRLRERFGTAYDTYVKNVPRWIPRLTPWQNNKFIQNTRRRIHDT